MANKQFRLFETDPLRKCVFLCLRACLAPSTREVGAFPWFPLPSGVASFTVLCSTSTPPVGDVSVYPRKKNGVYAGAVCGPSTNGVFNQLAFRIPGREPGKRNPQVCLSTRRCSTSLLKQCVGLGPTMASVDSFCPVKTMRRGTKSPWKHTGKSQRGLLKRGMVPSKCLASLVK